MVRKWGRKIKGKHVIKGELSNQLPGEVPGAEFLEKPWGIAQNTGSERSQLRLRKLGYFLCHLEGY